MFRLLLSCGIMLILSAASINVSGQSGKLPPFQMVTPSGKIFRAHQLPMGKPILLVYFSPECDHCVTMLDALFQQAGRFSKASIAFVTFLPVEKVSRFMKDYNVAGYPNMYAGTEGSTFFLKKYFHLTETPFVALYSSNGDLVASYRTEVPVAALARKLQTVN